ncbi:MAG: YeeE/YedE family protein [Alphaproteobacteria bacterium]|nr:YeeE/YedE family protein [Alphaproteobacteria bacterium]
MSTGTTIGVYASSFAAGLVFALGLGLAGMTQPGKVIGFLDFLGDWDPSLAFVMLGSILVYGVGFRLLTMRAAPILIGAWSLPTRNDLTPQLIVGSAMFGLGWGLAGFCPGPALTSVVTGSPTVLVFVGAMMVGMLGEYAVETLRSGAKKPATEEKEAVAGV